MNRAGYFGVLFDKAPTYEEINSGTPQIASCISLNEAFIRGQGMLAAEQGFEPQYRHSECRVLPLDDSAVCFDSNKNSFKSQSLLLGFLVCGTNSE